MNTVLEGTVIDGPDRAVVVKTRLIEISKTAGDLVLETGTLLLEYKANAYFKEDGFDTFDEAIEALHNAGDIDFGSRSARNLILIVQMFTKLAITDADKRELGMSKLRAIATIKDEDSQRGLLDAAGEMSVADVERAAKDIRNKAAGRDVDPLDPYTLKLSTTQKSFFMECLAVGRLEYSLAENIPDEAVLIDAILADWRSGCTDPAQLAQAINA